MALAALSPQAAIAHAMLLQASPAVGSTASVPPTQLELHFSEGVEPSFTSVEVADSNGGRYDATGLHTASGDAATLLVPLRQLGADTYTVIWHATSVDTHKTQGHFSFSVAP